jgi:hypothetical protein
MEYAVISGDLIASTSINEKGKTKIEKALFRMIEELTEKFKIYGRVIKGDYIECYVPEIANALRVALAIKSFVKSLEINAGHVFPGQKNRLKLFKTFGIRLAIGIGKLTRLDVKKGIMDGEAIYYSGRIIGENKTSNRLKVTIKNTLFIKSNDPDLDKEIQPLLFLIDVLISKITEKQSQVLYMKLLGYNEEYIAKKLKKRQSTVNEKSTIAGWTAIEQAVYRFEEITKNRFKK